MHLLKCTKLALLAAPLPQPGHQQSPKLTNKEEGKLIIITIRDRLEFTWTGHTTTKDTAPPIPGYASRHYKSTPRRLFSNANDADGDLGLPRRNNHAAPDHLQATSECHKTRKC